jgi:hypothetical protein
MNRVKLFGATLVATLAVGVVGVASASAAAPELGATSLPATFTSTGSGSSELKSAAGTIVCTSHSSVGEFTTQKAGKITITFKTCTSESVSCKSTGAAAGEIVVSGAGVEVVILKGPHLGAHITLASTLALKCGVLAVEVTKGVRAHARIPRSAHGNSPGLAALVA